jgi:hypothetical protein
LRAAIGGLLLVFLQAAATAFSGEIIDGTIIRTGYQWCNFIGTKQ